MSKILYIFNPGRKERLSKYQQNQIPREWYYGYQYLRDSGLDISILETSDFKPANDNANQALQQDWLVDFGLGINIDLFADSLVSLNDYDTILAIPDSNGLGLAYWKSKGLLSCDVIYFAMGLIAKVAELKLKNPDYYEAKYKQLISDMLGSCKKIVLLGKGEYEFAINEFSNIRDKFVFIPFGVDIEFWQSDIKSNIHDPVLFVGNDFNKDYAFVVSLAKLMPDIEFVCVSSKMGDYDLPSNLKLVKGDWRSEVMSDEELRVIYNHASILISPIKETLQPSGQSTSLQAMACGIPVMITKTKGFWDEESFINGENIFLMNENNTSAWEQKIRQIKADLTLYDKVSNQGKELVSDRYNVLQFGERIKSLLTHI